MVNKAFTNREVQLRNIVDFLNTHEAMLQSDAGIIALRDQLLIEQQNFAALHQSYLTKSTRQGGQKDAHKKEFLRSMQTQIAMLLRVTNELGDGVSSNRLIEIRKSIQVANGNALLLLSEEILAFIPVFKDDLANIPKSVETEQELDAYHNLYKVWAYGPSNNKRERSGIRQEILELIKNLRGLYKNQLAHMMTPFKYSHPDVFEEFRQASRIPKLGVRKEQTEELSIAQADSPSDSKKSTDKAA